MVVKSGPEAGRRVELDVEMAIGRQDGDLVLEDPEVSRRHAVLRRSGGSVVVEDLESTNGTFVNGERIRSPREVLPGDQVRVGRTTFEIEPDPRADDTVVSRPEDGVDHTIVSLPLPPGRISSAQEVPPREPRTDFQDGTQPLPSPGASHGSRRRDTPLAVPRTRCQRSTDALAKRLVRGLAVGGHAGGGPRASRLRSIR